MALTSARSCALRPFTTLAQLDLLCYDLASGGCDGVIIGEGWAPGKAILFGEHAVVYGQPALAVPVWQMRAHASVETKPDAGLEVYARDLDELLDYDSAPSDHPLMLPVRLALRYLGVSAVPRWRITLSSTIPIASGLGSGAAVSAAIVRAIASASGRTLSRDDLSALVFEVEKLHHGAPSGIDNTVISFGRPVFFRRGQKPHLLDVGHPFDLVIADSGCASLTRAMVAGVRERWERERSAYDQRFDRMGSIACEARRAIESGTVEVLGGLMDENHELLAGIGVSTPLLDRLASAARRAGAEGAKLSGGGGGGNLIALVSSRTATAVVAALRAAGAMDAILTTIGEPGLIATTTEA